MAGWRPAGDPQQSELGREPLRGGRPRLPLVEDDGGDLLIGAQGDHHLPRSLQAAEPAHLARQGEEADREEDLAERWVFARPDEDDGVLFRNPGESLPHGLRALLELQEREQGVARRPGRDRDASPRRDPATE
jgi:hypothetical protein